MIFVFMWLRTHFRPFTEVMRKVRREVTRKVILAAVVWPSRTPSAMQSGTQCTAADHTMP